MKTKRRPKTLNRNDLGETMNSNILPLQNRSNDTGLFQAKVIAVTNDTIIVQSEMAVINAKIAFGCLVKPMQGDTVLLSHTDECHVLSVLERTASQDMTLEFPENVNFSASKGSMNFNSNEQLNLRASSESNMIAPAINMTSAETHMTSGKITTTSDDLDFRAKKMSFFSDSLNMTVKRVGQFFETLIRKVSGIENSSVKNLVQNVEQTHASQSNDLIVTAKKDVRIDGKRIHMG